MTTIEEIRNSALYQATSIPNAIEIYEKSLLELGDLNSIAHAKRLERNRLEMINREYLLELREYFNEIYTLINAKYENIRFVIVGRRKSFISTDNKILKLIRENRSLDLLRDTNAFRIMLFGKSSPELITSCYLIMNDIIKHFIKKGLILCEADPVSQTENFDKSNHKILLPEKSYILDEFLYGVKDYVLNPKENGYQSLHTVFRTDSGECFEVQVRTYDMHLYAESGEASHKRYKTKKYNGANLISFDRSKIHIPGYGVSDEGVLFDFVGLEQALEILRRHKTF